MSAHPSEIDTDSFDSSSDIAKADCSESQNLSFDMQVESESEMQLDIEDLGRTSASTGLTMKEYEEQLKKLTAENFNLKLRVYFVEERLSKVTGINDKEDLIKKNIQLKVTCESQLKELEKKQELLFEASKAFELLQKEHTEEMERLMAEKDQQITELVEKLSKFETKQNELMSKFPNLLNTDGTEGEMKSFQILDKQLSAMETNLREEKERCRELEDLLKESQAEMETSQIKLQRLEDEVDQRMERINELVEELEQKERILASANFRIRKLEEELESKGREESIMRERVEEKNKTIESLKNSLAARDESIEVLENRVAKERAASQSLQSKLDAVTFQNVRLKEEVEIAQARLRRTLDSMSPRGKLRTPEEDVFKQKYEDLIRTLEELEEKHSAQIKELEEKLDEKDSFVEEFNELSEKHKKLEDDHRKACTALKNFIKRSGEEKKEKIALNQMLNSQEEMIAELKAQLNEYQSISKTRIPQDEKLSLAETGDNDRKFGCADPDNDSCCYEKDQEIQMILSKQKKKENLIENLFESQIMKCTCGVEEKMERVSKLEAEVVVLKQELEEKAVSNSEDKDIAKQFLVNELETKKCEIEKLNGELKRRNLNLQEVVNKELWDKNRQIEKLEKRLSELSELNHAKIVSLDREIRVRENQLKSLVEKMQDLGLGDSIPACLLEWCESDAIVLTEELLTNDEKSGKGDYETKSRQCLQMECVKAKEQAEKSDAFRKEAAEVCSLLSLRLEELASFLDSLLTNRDLLNGIGLQKRQDIKQAMEKSRELSRHLSLSFAKKNASDSFLQSSGFDFTCGLSLVLNDSLTQNESLAVLMSRDKVISEQTMIINRLREQLKVLNQEIKQRDIELSHCQEDRKVLDEDFALLSDQGIENQTLSICQDLSEDYDVEEDEEEEGEEEEEKGETEKKAEEENEKNSELSFSCRKTLQVEKNNSIVVRSQETSESEAWSEPDRSVSLARMGRIEDASLNVSLRKCDDSSDSSEGTLNENARPSALVAGKRIRSTESEVRRLQSRIKTLDEVNENLRLEIEALKIGKGDTGPTCRIQKNEEANLAEKLRKTMDRLDECNLTCRQLEEKLAAALERASASAVQLSKASETISMLELQISQMKEEVEEKNTETKEKDKRIGELEKKIEEMTIESELKIIGAIKDKEAAEKKTLEVECKLKDAENMSKEVESRVNEIEKEINESRKFNKETAFHFKEAEKQIDTAEKMMEEAERIKSDAERKSKDFQNFIDLMRKEVEEKMKEAERRVRKSEREKEELEKQVLKLKKRLIEAEKNKTEVETKVKEGKETIQCMEEKLKELEVAMDQCNEEAQRKIKEMQKKADAKVAELEMRIEERDWARKAEAEKKMAEVERISRELEVGFRKQLEEAEKRVKKAKESADAAIKRIQEESKKEEAELRQRLTVLEVEKNEECAELKRQLDEARLEASELELELTKLTNEKIHLEEELRRVLDKESALVKDNREIKGRYENSIHELENKLTKLTMNKSQLATRLEEIESTNIDLVSRITAIRQKEIMAVEQDYESTVSPFFSTTHGSISSTLFGEGDLGMAEINGNRHFARKSSTASDPGDPLMDVHSTETFAPPRRNMNSSPDLGIESDPGRFSSLEANQHASDDQGGMLGNLESGEIKKLEMENVELRRRLLRTRQALEETLTQLSAANQRKKQVERAICKQLHKTHHILKKARVNFESQDGGDSQD